MYLNSKSVGCIELLSSKVSKEERRRSLIISNQLNIKFDIFFEFGVKYILSQILSTIQCIVNIMDDTGTIFLANLIESYLKIQREVYDGNLSGDKEFEYTKNTTKWNIEKDIGEKCIYS